MKAWSRKLFVSVAAVAVAIGVAAGVGGSTDTAGGCLPAPRPAAVMPDPFLPLAPGNPFTTQLRPDVPMLDGGRQRAFQDELRFLVDQSVGVEARRWSAALYVVEQDGDVYDTAGRKKDTGAPWVRPTGGIEVLNAGIGGRGWPMAEWMRPDPGEGHLALYNPETGAYGEFFGAQLRGRSLSYGWGGFIPDVRRSTGTRSLPRPFGGATAFGGQFAQTIITEHEIRRAVERYRAGDHANAYIPHILGFEAYRHHPSQWMYPASRTDDTGDTVPEWGVGGNPNRLGNGRGLLPMGGILRIDPTVDVQRVVTGDGTAFGDMMARIIARTLQKHGATMTDQTEGGFVLLGEHVRDTDGTHDEDAFDYGDGRGDDGAAWLAPMLHGLLDRGALRFVDTGRNLEADEGAPAPPGVYRPPAC